MDEQELVARCKTGDRKALKLLYDRYAPIMMGISVRYTGSEESSKDILHDSFVKIFLSLGRFEYRGPGSLKAWVSRIAVNTALAFLKKNRELHPCDDMVDIAGPAEQDDDDTGLYESVPDTAIINCIGRLPKRLGVVFNLFIFEDMPHSDIALLLDISESASRVRLHRAKAMLAEALREYIKSRQDER